VHLYNSLVNHICTKIRLFSILHSTLEESRSPKATILFEQGETRASVLIY